MKNTEATGASTPRVVQKRVPGHTNEMLVCESCGAKAFLSERKRFNKRHPVLCSARKAFTKQIAQGTRCVDAEESDARIGLPTREEWDAIGREINRKDCEACRERAWDWIDRQLGSEPR